MSDNRPVWLDDATFMQNLKDNCLNKPGHSFITAASDPMPGLYSRMGVPPNNKVAAKFTVTDSSNAVLFTKNKTKVLDKDGIVIDELSDQQVEDICKELLDGKSETSKKIAELASNNGIEDADNSDKEIESEIIPISINQMGGQRILTTHGPISIDSSINEIIDGGDKVMETIINKDTATKNLESNFDLSTIDAALLMKVAERRIAGEKFNVFSALPKKMQDQIRRTSIGSGPKGMAMTTLNMMANAMIDGLITDMKVDQEFIDFQDAMKKEFNLPDVMDMYTVHQRELMEDKILKDADKLDEKFPDKAKQLRDISAAFKESHTFIGLKEAVSGSRNNRPKNSEMTKYQRIFESFNDKYKDHKFVIDNVNLLYPTLDRLLPKEEITSDDILGFVISFCKYCSNMSPDNIAEHTFMYYSIKNILSLEFINEIEENEFAQEIIKNVLEVINIIKSKKGGNN